MLVKTPAIKLGVEVRDSRVEDDRLILSGVANAMPCTVEIGSKELIRLAGKLMRPAVLRMVVAGLLRKES